MQRLALQIDMEDNVFLTKEVEKAIEGAVKARVRKVFEDTAEAETQRIIDARLKS